MFVESTMEAAQSLAQTKRRERMQASFAAGSEDGRNGFFNGQDESLLVTRIATLVRLGQNLQLLAELKLESSWKVLLICSIEKS